MQYTSSLTNKLENSKQSLLHQALKRKRTDSENANYLKRQFFITTKQNNSSNQPSLKTLNSPCPVFHLISTNRSSTNAELNGKQNYNTSTTSTSFEKEEETDTEASKN